jgi:hypothetical protein
MESTTVIESSPAFLSDSGGDQPIPDLTRDSALYRLQFEHVMQSRLERYRRLLLWMATFRNAGGNAGLSHDGIAWPMTSRTGQA